MAFLTLILDAPGPPLLFEEIDRFIEMDLAITLNLHYFFEKDLIKDHYGARIHYVDIDCHDKSAFIAAVVKDGGYNGFKTRLNISLDAEVLNACASPILNNPLRVIAQAGVGINHIDGQEAARCGVTVLNTPGSNSVAVAEYVLAQTLFLSRDLNHYSAETHQGRWSKGSLAPSREIGELTLGLVGTGRIAQVVAAKARALGMKVIATGSARFNKEASLTLKLERRETLDQLLQDADVVSIHTPLSAETRGLFGYERFARMRQGSILINTARGGIVDEHALATFMTQSPGHIKAVAIDTFCKEKNQFDSPLVGIANAVLTPHIAGNTDAAIRTAFTEIIGKLHAFITSSTLR
ncbi:D-isomer specific 2-hydroxyacid dehydrogenase family protein [Pseudomonas sp. H3(2019)]|uniref:NAD(P)-dependent oxidoreductase n=1 Tax=Pseudomonas sp. H3(2019) TaxID=2598724 RepID=UPI00119756AB|nr:NAD(P)-dependent oxidoreductase [Pseudomonas sp. H3(2019)]TVT81263.1 hydroxyacid dehydrogenase [Pseudomonas sp. H3(2019)]